MAAKKGLKISENGELRDATPEETVEIEKVHADNKPTPEPTA